IVFIFQIIAIIGLGSLTYVEETSTFVIFSFIWEFLCGIGAGVNATSTFAIVATHYKEEREKAIGMIESSSGVGLLMGPFFGAILYSIGGYTAPFYTICKIKSLLINLES